VCDKNESNKQSVHLDIVWLGQRTSTVKQMRFKLTIANITYSSVLGFILTAGALRDNLLCDFCLSKEPVLLREAASELLVECCSEGCLIKSGGCSVASTFLALRQPSGIALVRLQPRSQQTHAIYNATTTQSGGTVK
jgi:hypothetical protein